MRARERGAERQNVGSEARGERRGPRDRVATIVDQIGNRGALRRLRGTSAVVQRDDTAAAGAAARMALAAPASALPHRDHAERVLGSDLSSLRTVTGPAAELACATLGASAFTVGSTVAFAQRDPDPATVVHEATHALQQRHAATSSLPHRLPVTGRGDALEHEADARERGEPAARAVATGPIVALKPAPGQPGVTKGSIPLLAEPGGPAVAQLAPGTRVSVVSMIGPAYEVIVEDGPAAGKHGVLPEYALADAPAATAAKASSGRDPSVLTDGSLQSELEATDAWLVDHPIDGKRAEMESYGLALRAEWNKRHPVVAAGPPLQKLTLDTPLRIPLDAAPSTLKLIEGANGPVFVPSGAAVMGDDAFGGSYFGGQRWVYTMESKRELPIPWHLGSEERGLRAEPMITNEFYGNLNPEILPRGFPGADISFGGTYNPIEGFSWLKNDAGKSVKTPWVGWQIEAPSIVGYKTLDVGGYQAPGSLEKGVMSYVKALLNADTRKTDVERVPGLPRIRIEIESPTDRILHLQLSGEPNPLQAEELASARDLAAKSGVKLVIVAPPTYIGKPTVITTGGAPGVGYINTTSPLTVDPKFEGRQALGQASLLVAGAAFSKLNEYGDAIQQADAKKAIRDAEAQVREMQKTQPENGATIWVTWYPSGAPWFSVNQPGPRFGGVKVVFEREPSEGPGSMLYDENALGGHFNQRFWIPPVAVKPVTPQNTDQAQKRYDATFAWIERLQKQVDEYKGEGAVAHAWHGRIGKITGDLLDPVRRLVSDALTAIKEGRLADAEEKLYEARTLLKTDQEKLRIYEGPPWWDTRR